MKRTSSRSSFMISAKRPSSVRITISCVLAATFTDPPSTLIVLVKLAHRTNRSHHFSSLSFLLLQEFLVRVQDLLECPHMLQEGGVVAVHQIPIVLKGGGLKLPLLPPHVLQLPPEHHHRDGEEGVEGGSAEEFKCLWIHYTSLYLGRTRMNRESSSSLRMGRTSFSESFPFPQPTGGMKVRPSITP